MKVTNHKIGINAEEEAVRFIESNGFKVVERRYKTKFGEIDIIASKEKCVIFIEVKHRKNIELSYYAISEKSKQRIIDSANFYISQKNFDNSWSYRFDVILLDRNNIIHIENAFD